LIFFSKGLVWEQLVGCVGKQTIISKLDQLLEFKLFKVSPQIGF